MPQVLNEQSFVNASLFFYEKAYLEKPLFTFPSIFQGFPEVLKC